MDRIEPFFVRIPRKKHLYSGNRGSMGIERFGDRMIRVFFWVGVADGARRHESL